MGWKLCSMRALSGRRVSVSPTECTPRSRRGPMTSSLVPRLATSALIRRDQLAAELRSLGLRPGQDLLIHCSLRQVGHIEGGAAALLDALRAVSGSAATLVVPTQ